MFDQRQTKTQSAYAPRACHIALSEPLEDVRQEFRLDAFAVIAHDDGDVRVRAFERDFDAPAFGRELDRIREQVPDDLLQTVDVARDLAGERVQVGDYADAFGLRRRMRHIQSGGDHGDKVHRLYFELELAADDPSRVEQVLD